MGISGPGERLGVLVGLAQEAVDGGLEIDDALEDTALEALSGQFGEEAFDRVEQEAEVGVKWKWNLGCRSSQARTLGCLCVA